MKRTLNDVSLKSDGKTKKIPAEPLLKNPEVLPIRSCKGLDPKRSVFLVNKIIFFLFLFLYPITIILLYYPLMSLFDNVHPVSSLVYGATEARKDAGIDFFRLQRMVENNYKYEARNLREATFIFYEDSDCYYFVDRKSVGWRASCSYFAKTSGGCIRKRDGWSLARGYNLWLPMGYVDCLSEDFLNVLGAETTANGVDQVIGSGYRNDYYKARTNQTCQGILQRRMYLCRDGLYQLYLFNGVIVTNTISNILFEPVKDWNRGPILSHFDMPL